MMIKDDELQKKIEAGENIDFNDVNARAYRDVFKALSREPSVRIPSSFADKMLAKVAERKRKSDARDYFWFGVGLFLLLISFVIALVVTAPKLGLGFLVDISGYAGVFAFGIIIIVGFNWLDKRIVRKTVA